MDMRNGDMYQDLAAALQAGVPEESVGEVEAFIVRVTSGPFKGRIYRRTDHGLVRLPQMELEESLRAIKAKFDSGILTVAEAASREEGK